MGLRNPADRWGGVSILLHWASALLIVAIAIIGFYMTSMPRSLAAVQVYALHKSLGLTLLALVALRLCWRLAAGAPAPVPGTPRWQALAASSAHWMLYLLMLLVPLTGWAYNSASNFALQWFGQFNLPRLVAPDPETRDLWRAAHHWAFYALAAVVLLHAAAALKHHYFDRDPTLRRMLPRFGRRPRPEDPA